jgi:predicted nuclease with TOPRIM domain
MNINFTKEEIFEIHLFIDRYHSINVEVESLKKQAEEIKIKTEDAQTRLKEIKKEEELFMDELHKKYGSFSVQDISDSI